MTTRSVERTDRADAADPLAGFAVQPPEEHEDQPDPVTLCHPSHDGDGLLRWASATFDRPR